jgi:hypothetical protein
MKKLFFLASIVFLFVACETKYYTVLITNDSSKTVSYTYNDSNDTLASKTSKTYEVKAYTQSPQNINVLDGALSIKLNQKGDTFTFVDVDPIIFNVTNSLPFDIKIKADNYIWDDDNNSTELSIQANKERKDNLFIYTAKPKFTTTSNYKVVYDWDITNLDELDAAGNPIKLLSLIIR